MKDKCVTCHNESHHNIDDHISWRIAYIIGVGQLCLDCYDEIYIQPERKENEYHKSNETSRRVHNGLSR